MPGEDGELGLQLQAAAPPAAWSGWSPRLLKTATMPSPMNFSTSPPKRRVSSGAAPQ